MQVGRWISIAAVAIGGVGLTLYFFPGDPATEPVQRARLSAIGNGALKGLSVRGWMETGHIRPHQQLRVRFTFENHTSRKIVNLSFVDLQTPGFTYPSGWTSTIASPGQPLRQAPGLIPELNPGQTEWIETTLQPSAVLGKFIVTSVFRWTFQPDVSAPIQETVLAPLSVGPVEISGDARVLWARFAGRLYRLLKDLTLPLLLAVLAYLFQRFQNEQEHKEHARDRRQQIWSVQLPRLYDYAEQHYLPIVRGIRLVKRWFDGLPQGPLSGNEEEFRLCLYYFLRVLRRFQDMRDAKGGVFFQNRDGESVVRLAWWILNYHVEQRFEVKTRDRMLELMVGLDASFHAFQRKLAREPDLQQCCAAFAHWINGVDPPPAAPFKCSLELLELLKAVFLFETNRPFDEHWYGSTAEFDVREKYNFPDEPAKEVGELKETLKTYYGQTKSYVEARKASLQGQVL